MQVRERTMPGIGGGATERGGVEAQPPASAGCAIESFASERETLRDSIDELRARLAEIQAVEAQLQTEVGRFYVSASQLGASIAREPIVRAIREIIANLIGSEEIVIVSTVTPTPSGGPAILYAWTGESDWNAWNAAGWSPVEDVLRTGRSFYREDPGPPLDASIPPHGAALSACIALRAGERVVGAVPIFGLLPQKEELTSSDRDLCEMVGALGGQALYCGELHESLRGEEARKGSRDTAREARGVA